jgi:TRAP-type C4-dicarboxylate transport system permease large subunit
VIVLLLTPILLPIVRKLGVDPIHFGILMMTIVTMGVMTPPIGTAVYIVCGILKTPLDEYLKESLPFFGAVIALVVALIFLPEVVTFLPNLVYGR